MERGGNRKMCNEKLPAGGFFIFEDAIDNAKELLFNTHRILTFYIWNNPQSWNTLQSF